MNHTPLDLYGFKEAIQHTETFKRIANKEIQKIYFKHKTLDEFWQNYKWGLREGIDYLKKKKSVSGRDILIIEEVMSK